MFPELTTSRLLLQQVVPSDQKFIFEGLSHPDVIKFYGVQYDSYDATSAQMDWYENMLKEDSGIPWKMVEKKSGKSIGVITVYFYKPVHNKAEIGFWILPAFWNNGYAAEAMEIVLDYWKKVKGIHRMEAFVEEENMASAKMLAKTGFLYEGKMQDCEIKNGRYISLLIYAKIFD